MSNEECRNQGAPFRQFIVIERAGNFQVVQGVYDSRGGFNAKSRSVRPRVETGRGHGDRVHPAP